MASTIESSPQALKDKLTDVKSLLKTANNRLQEEVSRYEIFATKASASSSSNVARLNEDSPETRADIIRTITDISTLESVLSCPIFDRIVNVTDSLDQLSYQLNLHPSITEFDIDTNSGELILTPPMEFTALNDLIDSAPNDYTDNNPGRSLNFAQNNSTALVNDLSMHQTSSDFYANADLNNGYARAYPQKGAYQAMGQQNTQTLSQEVQDYRSPSSGLASCYQAADTEKLIANGNGGSRIDDKPAAEPLYLQPNSNEVQDTNRRQYKSNGHFTPDEIDVKSEFQSTQSMNQVGSRNNEQRRSSYSNELYKTSHGLNQPHDTAINQQHHNHQQQKYTQQQQKQHHQQQQRTAQSSEQNHRSQRGVYPHNPTANGRLQINQTTGVQYNRGSCSPSSDGSTVRLADECDSGASSYQSQQARGSLPSYQSKGPDGSVVNGSKHESVEHELIKKLSPELDRIKVTLERDEMGLGITIAGYTLQDNEDEDEDKEISGIFIKSVTPGSPADRCGKIKEFDQIFSVNGNELVGYSNDEAVSLLRQTGKVVTLELMRHSDELKYNKLKAALAHAQCPHKSKRSDSLKSSGRDTGADEGANIATPNKSSIPISRNRDSANKSPTKPPFSSKPKTALVQVSTYQESSMRKAKAQEAICKNDSLSKSEAAVQRRGSREITSPLSLSHIPVAAQRGGTNKVIETKQGSRNTIDIKSPACQTAMATYVNKIDDLDLPDSVTKQNSTTGRLQREASDEFVRLVPSEEPEWDKDVKIIVLHKVKPSQGLGFAVKEYADPKNPAQPIIMITSITPGGVADRDGRLSVGDLLIFVDDKDLRGQVLSEAVKALKKTDGEASLGVLKLKRN